MDRHTAKTLADLNRTFYAKVADTFHRTRSEPWPGWSEIAPHLQALASRSPRPRILDLGCGNGRFGAFVASLGIDFEYTGVDGDETLLAFARERSLANTHYLNADLLEDNFTDRLASDEYDVVALFGVVHHVPGREARAALLESAATRLAPNGLLAVTLWEFGGRERFAAKAISWETFNRTADVPVDPDQVEANDFLLPFADSPAVRYCHFLDEGEIAQILARLPLRLVRTFRADGKSGDLNRYLLLRP